MELRLVQIQGFPSFSEILEKTFFFLSLFPRRSKRSKLVRRNCEVGDEKGILVSDEKMADIQEF